MNIEEIVKVPYTTQPRMTRNVGDVFNFSPSRYYLEEKRIQLNRFGFELYGNTSKCEIENHIQRCEEFLGKPITGNIVDFAMNFEEDVAIMHNGIMSAICFCFPSSWVPSSALNKTLEEIHRPVADGDQLRRVSYKLAKTMADPVLGSFCRYVWTITKVPELSNHPVVKEKYRDTELSFSNLYFRIEKQTTMPLSDGITSLFFVKVEVYPLSDVWNPVILNSINTMSENILEYKNLKEIKKLLNEKDEFEKAIYKNEYYDILD